MGVMIATHGNLSSIFLFIVAILSFTRPARGFNSLGVVSGSSTSHSSTSNPRFGWCAAGSAWTGRRPTTAATSVRSGVFTYMGRLPVL